MGKAKTYKGIEHCGHCDKDTKQLIYESGHERDSSGDWRECLECGWRYSGLDGEWHEPYIEEDES